MQNNFNRERMSPFYNPALLTIGERKEVELELAAKRIRLQQVEETKPNAEGVIC